MADIFEDIDIFSEELEEYAVSGDQTPLFEHFRVIADKGQTPLRVDKFLTDHLEHASRNRIQLAADAGMIMANGAPVKSNYKVKPCDVITVMMDRPRHDSTIEAEDIPLEIVYEDEELMVINKPAGMACHNSGIT